MLETIRSEIREAKKGEPFAEYYQKYIFKIEDDIIQQEVQHVRNLISSTDDMLAVNSDITQLTRELNR